MIAFAGLEEPKYFADGATLEWDSLILQKVESKRGQMTSNGW